MTTTDIAHYGPVLVCSSQVTISTRIHFLCYRVRLNVTADSQSAQPHATERRNVMIIANVVH